MDLYYWLDLFSSILISGYLYLVPVLILLYLIFKKNRLIIIKWITISNGWFVAGNLILTTNLTMEFIAAWYNQHQYEGYDFYYSRSTIFSPYGSAFWLRLLTIPASVFFLFKRIRRSIVFTSILIAILLLTNERLVLFITGLYQDYLPSSWAYITPVPWWQNDAVYIIFYLLIITATYYLQQWRKKSLPTAIS